MNTIPDITVEELDMLLGDGPNADFRMKSHTNPVDWWGGWTDRFKGHAPDPALHPIAYARMLQDWEKIVQSEHGIHFARVLWCKDGESTQYPGIDTRNQTLLYHFVPPEWIYAEIGAAQGFELAYLVAHPDHQFPARAINAYFDGRPKYMDVSDMEKHVTALMIKSIDADIPPLTASVVFSYLHAKDMFIYKQLTYLSSLSPALLVTAFIRDAQLNHSGRWIVDENALSTVHFDEEWRGVLWLIGKMCGNGIHNF